MSKKADSSVWTADKGQPPREPDDASATPTPKTKPAPKPKKTEPKGIRGGVWTEDSGVPVPQEPEVAMAKGGSASSRADGIAQRGKTRGTIVMCGGGMYKK